MEELINEAKKGNENAYVTLINEISSDLYKVARARLENTEDINDAINETILKSYKNLNKLKHNEFFKTWITKILINECNLIYHRNNRQLNILKRIVINKNCEENIISDIDNQIDFEKMLNKLNYNERIAVVLHYNNKYKIDEIADILNENPNTIKTRLRRAKEKIKEKYKGGVKL